MLNETQAGERGTETQIPNYFVPAPLDRCPIAHCALGALCFCEVVDVVSAPPAMNKFRNISKFWHSKNVAMVLVFVCWRVAEGSLRHNGRLSATSANGSRKVRRPLRAVSVALFENSPSSKVARSQFLIYVLWVEYTSRWRH